MFLMVLKSVILAWGTGTLHHGDRDLLLSLFLGLFLPPLLSGTQLVSSPVLGNFPSQEKTDSRNTLEVSGWRVWTSSLYLQIKYSGREMAMLPRTEVEAKQMTYHPRIPAWQGGGVGGRGSRGIVSSRGWGNHLSVTLRISSNLQTGLSINQCLQAQAFSTEAQTVSYRRNSWLEVPNTLSVNTRHTC